MQTIKFQEPKQRRGEFIVAEALATRYDVSGPLTGAVHLPLNGPSDSSRQAPERLFDAASEKTRVFFGGKLESAEAELRLEVV